MRPVEIKSSRSRYYGRICGHCEKSISSGVALVDSYKPTWNGTTRDRCFHLDCLERQVVKARNLVLSDRKLAAATKEMRERYRLLAEL